MRAQPWLSLDCRTLVLYISVLDCRTVALYSTALCCSDASDPHTIRMRRAEATTRCWRWLDASWWWALPLGSSSVRACPVLLRRRSEIACAELVDALPPLVPSTQ